MKQSIYLLLAMGLVLVSCNQGWDENEKEEFTTSCEEGYVTKFKSTLGPEYIDEVDLDELDKLAERQCDCIYEAIKEKYETPEEAYSKGIDAVMEEVKGCDATDEELDKLLKE